MKYIKESNITWPVYINNKKGDLVILFKIAALPTLVIIEPIGKYVVKVGYVKYSELIKCINYVKEYNRNNYFGIILSENIVLT